MPIRSPYIYLIFLLGAFLASPAYADEFSRAQKLLKENKPKQAYQFLLDEEGYHMGEPAYDLLLARTALASGYFHEAIFAFERVLIHEPNNLMARIEMAIAYFRINELDNAKRHLEIVLQVNPTGEIRHVLDDYLNRINEKIASRKHDFSGSHSFRQGWDSNINSATNESEVKLTIGTYRPTDGVDKETSDTFSESINRLNYNYHFNINADFFSSIGYSIRENNNKNFDSETADIKLGYQHNTSVGKISVPLSYQTMWLDNKQLRDVTSIGTSLNRSNKQYFTNYDIQYGEIRYPGQAPLNVDFYTLSFVIGTSNSTSKVNQQYAVFFGDETAGNELYKFNAREYWGLQVRLPVKLTPRHYVSPRVVYQQAEYKQRHPFFLEKREDDYITSAIDWDWYLSRNWLVTAQISHTENQSSVDLYNYARTTAFFGFTFRYQ